MTNPVAHPAGEGEEAAVLRENLFESLPPKDQERFLDELEKALEEGVGEDEAWNRAWKVVQDARDGDDAKDGTEDFALEDEKVD